MNDSDKPITLAELKEELKAYATKEELGAVEIRLRTELHEQTKQLRSEMSEQTKDIIEHFNVVAEQIRADVSGANADEISSMKDDISDHETRISKLETTH